MAKKSDNVVKADIYQAVTDKIISAIEQGAGAWRMPWHVEKVSGVGPINAVSEKAYRGVNVLILWATAMTEGYASPLWATYKQWADLGAKVRTGSRGTQIVFYKKLEPTDAEASEQDDQGRRSRFVAKGFHVFNSDQVDGFDAVPVSTKSESERIQAVEDFVAQLGADVRHGGSKAFFVPAADYIQIPPLNLFDEVPGYYATLLHELTHWTGHKTRLDRDMSARFRTESYAAEELVAELGAAFLCSTLGISSEPRPDHAAYIESWFKVLKGDKRAIFTASSLAQKAADFLYSKQPETVEASDTMEERQAA
jgi:antirestriction protein ArdC